MVIFKEILTKFKDREIVFHFITTPETKEINKIKGHLFSKKKHINYLQKDVQILNIKKFTPTKNKK